MSSASPPTKFATPTVFQVAIAIVPVMDNRELHMKLETVSATGTSLCIPAMIFERASDLQN